MSKAFLPSISTRRKLPGIILGIVIVSAISGPVLAGRADAGSDLYRLKPETHVKVGVVEWLASTGEYKEWTALNGEYVVSPEGTISIPMIGEMKVDDKTTSELATDIGDTLKQLTGLAQPPVASVQVIKYPMIYVTGTVEKPSELEYRPGLTVKQAIAMAGGRQRRSNPMGEYSDTQQITYAGELNRMELQLKQLSARKARLLAELNDKPAIDFPPELVAAPEGSPIRQIVNSENTLFTARADALRHQLESATDLETLLTNEISVLDEKMVSQDRQVKIAQDELDDISKLVDTKILTTSRKTSLERIVADMQSGKLDMVVASMQAKQKVSETQRDALNLKGQRKTDVGQELQATNIEIEDTKLKRMTTLQLLQIAGASISKEQSLKSVDLQPLEYWVTHGSDGGDAQKVPEGATLQPADVLEVRYNVSSSIDGAMVSSIATDQLPRAADQSQ
ncbi:polysaccharide biosynthesis/export family protein [Rhizobium tubonense]|uniref:Sugar transporter n=1 Tax=Rhizobium tubonense TaxID=484088 RepID=A0A2W4D1P8_9HYPH|nr:polysaccharide biosynthesis/export family protein [Rhizobium tubonense]PZM16235.1 sugar transporter [Rhizobium tubonense]